MKPVEINYQKKDAEGNVLWSGTVSWNAPENADEFMQVYGPELLFEKAMDQLIIDARRLCYAAEGDNEKAQEAVNAWTPGVARKRTASGFSKKALGDALSKLSKDDLLALFQKAGIQLGG